jgi:hypothetical protein
MKLVLETFVQHDEERRFAVGSKPRAVRGDARSAARMATVPTRASAPPTGTPSTPPGGASAPLASMPRKVTLAARFWRVRKRSRYLSASVTRSVYVRDQGQCSFVSADARRCGARAFLQLDHVEPWAALGAPVAENIRILCRAHNQLHARNCFGKKYIAAKFAARRAEANDERTKI